MSYIKNSDPSVIAWVAAAGNSHILRVDSAEENTRSQFPILSYSLDSSSLDSSLKSDWNELKKRIGLLTISIFFLALAVVAVYQGINISSYQAINIARPFLYFPGVIMLGLAIAGFYQSKKDTICEAYKDWKTTKKIIEFRETNYKNLFIDSDCNDDQDLHRIIGTALFSDSPHNNLDIIRHEDALFESWIANSSSNMEKLKSDARDLLSRVVVFNYQYFANQP